MKKLTTEEFIKRAKNVHGDRYDYSRTNYLRNREKVEIICSIHGSFFQNPRNHLKGFNCPKCGQESRSRSQRFSITEFVNKAKNVFPDYNYDEVDYTNEHIKIKVGCPLHGFFYKIPNDLLNGTGCPECNKNKYKGEEKIKKWLKENNKNYKRNFKIKELNYKSYDFFLEEKNLLIEYNGKQHYEPRCFGGINLEEAKQNLKKQKHHDWLKRKYARDHNIELLTIPYWEFKNIETILETTIYKN